MYIFDATPLIYLAKTECLALVEKLDHECFLPRRVYREVVPTGIEEGYADAKRIERATESGVLSIFVVEETGFFEKLRRYEGLSTADVSVLTLAEARNGTAIMDEASGRTVADAEGIPIRGTAFFVLQLQREGIIDAEEARSTIDAMLDAGWYCAPDVYARIVRKIEELS